MRLNDLSIKHKLTFITMLTSFVALLLACAAFATYEQVTFRRTMIRDFSILANMIEDAVAPGLAFNDPGFIEQALKVLAAHPHVLAAAVFDTNRVVVAKFQNSAVKGKFVLPPARSPGSHFEKDRLDTFQRIMLAGGELGTIYIGCDLKELTKRFQRYGLIASLVLVASSLVAFVLSGKLRNIISRPISHLAGVATAVAAEKNYSLRAVKHGEDELGHLIDSFNEMLNQIGARDGALLEARNNLEKRVEERTKELQSEVMERRRTDEEREKFFAMVENSGDFIAISAMSGQLLYMNPAGRNLAGLDRAQDVRLFALKDFADEKNPNSNGGTSAGGTVTASWEGESQMRNLKTGAVVDVFAQTFVVRHPESGKPFCLATVQRDITERKRAEAELDRAHRELLDASRLAGMAEVATGVLHNVGNVLNSVNVSATLVSEQVRDSKVGNLAKVCSLLRAHHSDLADFLTNDPKGRQIPKYLETLQEHLTLEQTEMRRELDTVRHNVEHIKEIVAMQQNYAKVSGVVETVNVPELVEHALEMNTSALDRHQVQTVREFEPVPPLPVDKHKVLQILVNLIRNAKYACDDSMRADKQLTVRIAPAHDRIRIDIIDNGVGITADNMKRIFNHGFTTRENGHGFGLHSAALAAKEIGASLTAHSDGEGSGATFSLRIPLLPHSPLT